MKGHTHTWASAAKGSGARHPHGSSDVKCPPGSSDVGLFFSLYKFVFCCCSSVLQCFVQGLF